MSHPKKEGELLDHEYDGIQELDNPLPKWWKQLFYLTIIFSAGYFIYYTFGSGPSIQHEFKTEASKIESLQPKSESPAPQKAAKAPAADTTSPEAIAAGKAIFVAKCAACHLADGGGLIGPNLTDKFWINGDGSSEAITKVIHDGVPAKGMLAWGALLSETDIQNLVAFIHSIQGSSPATPKAPEGNEVK